MDTNNVASPSLIKMHVIFSGISFLLFSVFLLLTSKEIGVHYFQGKVLAITHIATLCWLTTFLFALFYQFVPQIFSRKLFSTILAKIGFFLFAIGSITLVVAFWKNSFSGMLISGAHLLSIPFLILLINVVVTAIKSSKRDIEQWYFITSVFWLLATVTVGVLLAMNFKSPIFSSNHLEWLKLHANIGFTGWFLLFIIGLAAKSMGSSEVVKKDKKMLQTAFYLINVGLILYFLYQSNQQGELLQFPLLIIVLGILAALIYLSKLLAKQSKSLSKILYPFFFLIIPVGLAFFLVFTSSKDNSLIIRAGIIYGVSVLLGFVGLWTFSQLGTLFSFIKPSFNVEKGTKDGIRLKQATDYLSVFHLSSYLVAVLALIVGILVKEESINLIASIILVLSAVLFNVMLFRAIFLKIKE